MTGLKQPPQTPFQFALSQLTPEVKGHALRTLHGAITTALTDTLTSQDGNREEQQAEARCLAKLIKMVETELGMVFSSVNPSNQGQVRYVSPSQLPGAVRAAEHHAAEAAKPRRRKATPRTTNS